MKNLIILLSILLAVANILAQDKEPVQHKFYFPAYSESDSIYLSDTLDYFKQKEFMLGWHWGGSKKISQALDMNQYDAEYYQDETYMNEDVYSILKPEHIWTHYDNTRIMNTKGIVFEPTFRSWELGNGN